MKKIFNLLVVLCALFLFTGKGYADTFNLTVTGDDTFGSTITLKVKVASLTGFSDGFLGLDTRISYDSAKLELVSVTGLNGFEVVYDMNESDKIVAYAANGASVNMEILELKFKNNDMSNGETTTISFSEVYGSDGEEDIAGTIASKTITFDGTAVTHMLGDANENGKLDLQDVILSLKYYLGALELTPEKKDIVDMDENEVFNLKDIIALLKAYLGV